jgi:hypothetical protein
MAVPVVFVKNKQCFLLADKLTGTEYIGSLKPIQTPAWVFAGHACNRSPIDNCDHDGKALTRKRDEVAWAASIPPNQKTLAALAA